jgi:hypothetical protein
LAAIEFGIDIEVYRRKSEFFKYPVTFLEAVVAENTA